MSDIRAPFRYHGGKFRLASQILPYLPSHACYTEAFGGAAGLLLRKPPARSEIYNDLDDDVVNFFRVLREDGLRARLKRSLALTPFARTEFLAAYTPAQDCVVRARRLVVRAQMGFGSGGATKQTTGFRTDADYNVAAVFRRYPDRLEAIAERFRGVLIECRDGIDVLREHDTLETLHFVDPPYVADTRSAPSNRRIEVYRHEMPDAEHLKLLDVLQALRGMVLVSGYSSGLYAEALTPERGWQRVTFETAAAGKNGAVRREESLWMNAAAIAHQRQLRLIA